MVQSIKLFGNKKIMQIINFFIENSSSKITQTKLIKETKIAKATAVKWMHYLVANDMLKLERIGVSNIYQLNNENLVIKHIKIIKTILSLKELKKLKDKGLEIYLYGSASRGEDTEKSDIDILVIGRTKRREIVDVIDQISKKINRKISFSIFSNVEWSMMRKKDNAYYNRVEKDKIRLI
jgi:predicted nucleotidyltransferase